MSLEAELKELTLGTSRELAPSTKRVAMCVYGPSVYAKPGSYRGYDVMLILDGYTNGVRGDLRVVNGNEVRFLLVERNLIESDVKRGALGDFLTERLLYPYRSMTNDAYLENLALQARSRITTEEVKDLVLGYGEMCRGLVAAPEFFPLSRMRKRARAFIASMDEYLRLLDPSVRERNISLLRDSFRSAIMLLKSDLVELEGDNVTFPDNTVDRWLKDRTSEQVVNILKQSQRAFYGYITRGRAVYLNLDLMARELFGQFRLSIEPELVGRQPEDPKNYLYIRTAAGLVSLNERSSLEDVLSKFRRGRPITISPLAGVLNEVFLVSLGKEEFVAKKFTDWHDFKWFTLNLVSFGSKFFAVSGKSRMTNEYGINRFLAKRGLKVPQIIHASISQRLLVETYISGIPLHDFVAQVATQSALTKSQYRLAESFGEAVARIHQVGVSIGDSKPENFVAKGDDIFTVDLEQARKGGDYAWDLAELLFYTGHYSRTPAMSSGLRELVEAFIQGYGGKGDVKELKTAAGLRYTKVFSLWTPATILLEISKMLREAS